MNRTITQRELRNQSAAVLREMEAGRTIVVTRNGTPVAELRPIYSRDGSCSEQRLPTQPLEHHGSTPPDFARTSME
jgi:prevent-host-death family protein